jgi:hypothetical protein
MRYLWALLFTLSAVVASAASCGGNGGTNTTGGHTGGHGGGTSSSTSSSSGEGGGGIFVNDGGTDGCTPLKCADVGANCGVIGDGCGGMIDCGQTCPMGQTCGGAGQTNVCGTPPCTPKTCADLGFDCGPAGDGCGGQLDCGQTCPTPGDTCGGGGQSGVCGHGTMCMPKTCQQLGINCGPAGDGCGGQLDCGSTCPAGQTCGGGGQSGVCGAPPCTPTTCAAQGANCGAIADGCNGILQCGTCSGGQVCGASMPNVCGSTTTCTNLCLKQVTCSNPNVTTTISGTVYAPNGVDPLPNALVYVPNAPVQPFPAGVSCDNCGAAASGSPLVSAVTGVDGKFTIKNAPVTTNVPLVIQIGRWRRQVTIPSVASCTNTAVPATLTRLPKNKGEGDIPLMAFATGSVDALECVMRKIGIDDSEFTVPYFMGGNGRVQIYTGSGSGGATINGDGQPTEDQLWSDPNVLNHYDMVLFPCQGAPYDQATTSQQNLINYANAGGRIFATHYSYVWLYNVAPFSGTANWAVGGFPTANQTGTIDTTFPKGQLLAQWLQVVGASTTLGQIPLQQLRQDTSSTIAPTQTWITVPSPSKFPAHFTFNTPIGAPAAQQCGRVLYDDFHVEDASADPYFTPFPTECAGGAMTPQEKLLEFMLFDLASCVTSDVPQCTPKTCAQLGAQCGPAGDGCGGLLNCGTCPSGQTCSGSPATCHPACTPKTCAQLGYNCGPAGDGCGGLLNCGTCPAGQTCGGGGMPGVCGNQTCTPKNCQQQNIQCGPAGDGCGNLIQCGSCPAGQTCGGGGQPGVCGAPMCTPKTCAQLNANCGAIADGCGNIINCGTCQLPQTCGGGGTANQCGGSGPH